MENFNAIKFSFLVPKSQVKVLLDISFDLDIQLLYPRLSTAPELVKVKGLASIESFQELISDYDETIEDFFAKLGFCQTMKFKFVEVNEINQPIPFAEKKEIIENSKK